MSESSSATEGNEKIDRLQKDLEELKTNVEGSSEQVNKAVEELRKAVVDIRSAVSEIENPFNLLRVITNEKDLSRLNRGQPLIKKLKTGEVATIPEEPEVEPEAEEEQTEKKVKEARFESANLLNFKHGSSLVRWIYTMLDLGFDEDSLRRICQYCEYFDLVPRGSSIFVSNMVSAIVKAKSKQLFEEDVILSIYTAAQAAGTKVKPDDIIEPVMQVLRRKKSEKMEKIENLGKLVR